MSPDIFSYAHRHIWLCRSTYYHMSNDILTTDREGETIHLTAADYTLTTEGDDTPIRA